MDNMISMCDDGPSVVITNIRFIKPSFIVTDGLVVSSFT